MRILDILCGSGIFLTVSELIEGRNVMFFSKTLDKVKHGKHTRYLWKGQFNELIVQGMHMQTLHEHRPHTPKY